MTELTGDLLRELLEAVGAHLGHADSTASIIVVGGAGLIATGMIERTTQDVDVIARTRSDSGERSLVSADPLPEDLAEAIGRVARDYSLDDTWMNTEVGAQWTQGLPEWLLDDTTWVQFGGLEVGFAGRLTLIALKLFGAVDRGPESVHYQDLIGLAPTREELERAAQWVAGQDQSSHFPDFLKQVLAHVDRDLGRAG